MASIRSTQGKRFGHLPALVALAGLALAGTAAAGPPAQTPADPPVRRPIADPPAQAPADPTPAPPVEQAVAGDAPVGAIGPEGPPRPISLSISGGVSLGAYEAGGTWALSRYLRAVGDDRALRPERGYGRADLVGITGASAGAINTLVSALLWCKTPAGAGTIEDNLVRETWLHVGFDGLLPPDPLRWREAFLPLDGLLSRSAFAPGVKALQSAIDGGDFRPHCRVPLAFTVTRGVPWQTEVAGLTVANQRFAVPLELIVDAEGQAWFVNHTSALRNESQLGQYLFLAETAGDVERARRRRTGGQPPARVVPGDLVVQAVLASSAFPGAFSPVTLVTCLPHDRCPAEHPPAPDKGSGWLQCGARDGCDDFSQLTCDGLSDPGRVQAPCPSRFVDGGFFDNVPLGVAMAQAELSTPDDPLRRPVDYLYFDPDVRRHGEAAEQSDDLGDRGMSRVLAILGDATVTATTYELATVLRFSRFNRPIGWYAGRFGELAGRVAASLEQTGQSVSGDRATLLGPPLEACLADLGADADGCGDLPPSCLALADHPPAIEPPPALPRPRVESCLPTDHAAVRAALTRLGRRLDCRAQAAAHDRSITRQHPPIMDHVVDWASRTELCLLRATPASETMLEARLGRDVALAREDVEGMRRSAAPDRTLALPSRFAELAAGQLRNFGGFFDDAMRRHDYAVGIYDGLVNIAEWQCRADSALAAAPAAAAIFDRCRTERMGLARAILGVDSAPTIAAIVDALTVFEAGTRAHERGAPMPAGDPLARCPADDDGPCAVQRALATCAEGDGRRRLAFAGATVCLGASDMDRFVAALKAERYRPTSVYMTRLLEDPEWASTTLGAVTRRLTEIEDSEATRARRRAITDPEAAAEHRLAEENADSFRFTFTAAGSALRAAVPPDPGFDLDPSTIPDDIGFTTAHLLPFRVGVGLLQGGVGIGWEPRFGTRAVQGRLGLDPVVWRGRGRGTASEASLALALRPWDSILWGALSLGARVHRPWDGARAWTASGLAALDLVADRLRLEVSYRVLDFDGRPPADSDLPIAVSLWLLDLPGLVWLAFQ